MIFWEYIKGLNVNPTTPGIKHYTYLNFPYNKINSAQTGDYEYKATPRVYINNINSFSSSTCLGSLLSSYDYIELESYKNSNLELILKKSSETDAKTPQYFKIINNINSSVPFKIKLNDSDNVINISGQLEVIKGEINTYLSAYDESTQTTYGMTTNGKVNVSNDIIAHNITIANKCEALYFNATSDERAKENFIYVSKAHALEWINNLNIYTFNYRDNGKSSIGITTQQVQYEPINDFNFVDNLEATGENGDYMTIKESKLVYMCMSAIQELSQQNKALQEKLVTLEDELKKLKK